MDDEPPIYMQEYCGPVAAQTAAELPDTCEQDVAANTHDTNQNATTHTNPYVHHRAKQVVIGDNGLALNRATAMQKTSVS